MTSDFWDTMLALFVLTIILVLAVVGHAYVSAEVAYGQGDPMPILWEAETYAPWVGR